MKTSGFAICGLLHDKRWHFVAQKKTFYTAKCHLLKFDEYRVVMKTIKWSVMEVKESITMRYSVRS